MRRRVNSASLIDPAFFSRSSFSISSAASPRALAGDRGGRRAGGRPGPLNRHACRESPRPRPRPPWRARHAPRELIVELSWLNQLGDVISEHGISLLWWRSGGVRHPHDMPTFRFPRSPAFGDSSVPAPTTDIASKSSKKMRARDYLSFLIGPVRWSANH